MKNKLFKLLGTAILGLSISLISVQSINVQAQGVDVNARLSVDLPTTYSTYVESSSGCLYPNSCVQYYLDKRCQLSQMDINYVPDIPDENGYDRGCHKEYNSLYYCDPNLYFSYDYKWKKLFISGIRNGINAWHEALNNSWNVGGRMSYLQVRSIDKNEVAAVAKYRPNELVCKISVKETLDKWYGKGFENGTDVLAYYRFPTNSIELNYKTITEICTEGNYTDEDCIKYIQSIVCHEIGHNLGLGDNYYSNQSIPYISNNGSILGWTDSIMSYGSDWRTLDRPTSLDLRMINYMYFALPNNRWESSSDNGTDWGDLMNSILYSRYNHAYDY